MPLNSAHSVRTFRNFLLFLLLCLASSFSQKLYVFHPAAVRPQVLQKAIAESCPGVDVTVFGRYKDFEERIGSEPPDAVLAPSRVIEQTDGYGKILSGTKNGAFTVPYILISVDSAVNPAALGEKTVGMVDFLGRKGMNAFADSIFKAAPRLKRVTKIEDLLPLLTFKMASAVLVPETQADYFRKVSNLNFTITVVPGARAGLAVLAARDPAAARKIKQALEKAPAVQSLLEVDGWK